MRRSSHTISQSHEHRPDLGEALPAKLIELTQEGRLQWGPEGGLENHWYAAWVGDRRLLFRTDSNEHHAALRIPADHGWIHRGVKYDMGRELWVAVRAQMKADGEWEQLAAELDAL